MLAITPQASVQGTLRMITANASQTATAAPQLTSAPWRCASTT